MRGSQAGASGDHKLSEFGMRSQVNASNAPQLRKRWNAFIASWHFAVVERDF